MGRAGRYNPGVALPSGTTVGPYVIPRHLASGGMDFARGRGKRDWVEHEPDFDSIRDDPRFQALLAQLRP
jgi:hypothetical protein